MLSTKAKAGFFGTLALDDISLPSGKLKNIVGGSAAYGSLASGIFCETAVISVLGSDYPAEFLKKLRAKKVDTALLQKSKLPSFRWIAEYSGDLASCKTINREVNSFEEFDSDRLKGALSHLRALFVSKNDPLYQAQLFSYAPQAIKIMESRGNWVTNRRDDLKAALKLADVFLIHDEELKLLAGDDLTLPEMIEKVMSFGPKVVILLRGEHGLIMYGAMGTMMVPSYPLTYAVDPTGAGDALGGALAGILACMGKLTPSSMRKALVLAGMTASFAVEDFGTGRLEELTQAEVVNRTKLFLGQLPTALDVHIRLGRYDR